MRFHANLGGNMRFEFLAILAGAALAASAHAADSTPIAVTIDVDARATGPELTRIWRFFGADEPNYATMKDGRTLLGELGRLAPGEVFFRAHNLLSSGDGTPALKWGSSNAYTEDATGNAVYDWHVIDGIFDAYLSNGVKPYVQLGFMPQALSSAPKDVPYKHSWRPGFDGGLISGGWSYPPRDYARWSELCFELTRHLVQRYGEKEVLGWWFEVWNEPNGPAYWKASADEFYKLHDFAVAGVRRALPAARVGGPHTAGHGGTYMEGFLDHVTTGTNYATGERGTPTDFLAFHAKGAPIFVDGHVRMGIQAQLSTIDTGFRMIAAHTALKGKPVILGESDPEGCAACQGPRFGYRNGTVYSSYTAASFAREWDLAARHGVNLQGAVTWAFEFEDQPYFAGFRQLASNGIPMPVFNVFRMFSHMHGQRVPAKSSAQVPLDDIIANGVRGAPDIGTLAVRDGKNVAVLVWHYHDDDVPGPDAAVELRLAGAGRNILLAHYRIDGEHGNAYAAWQKSGSPIAPDKTAYDALHAASDLAALPADATSVERRGSALSLKFSLPRQGVSLLVLGARD
jgi:xylan 1,4-beta-xylosidase